MPRVAIVAGINGAGKTTASQRVLRDVLKMPCFVNADAIARGLNGFNPESEAAKAGRIMLDHLRELAARQEDFSLETTLAGRAYAGWLGGLKASGYEVYLYYFWLDGPETSIARVAARVRAGATTYRRKRSACGTPEACGTSSTSTGRCAMRGGCTIIAATTPGSSRSGTRNPRRFSIPGRGT